MFEAFRDIWDFLTNRQQHWSAKVGIGGVIVFSVVMFELSTGVFSSFVNSQRISQLNLIEDALAKPELDSDSKVFLKSVKHGIIERGAFPSVGFGWIWKSITSTVPEFSDTGKQTEVIEENRKSRIRVASIAGFWILMMIATIIIFLTEAKLNRPNVFSLLAILFEMFAIIGVLLELSNSIHGFLGWNWEIFINTTFQILSIAVYFKLGPRTKRRLEGRPDSKVDQ